VETHGDPRNTDLNGVPIPVAKGREFDAAFVKLLWPDRCETTVTICQAGIFTYPYKIRKDLYNIRRLCVC